MGVTDCIFASDAIVGAVLAEPAWMGRFLVDFLAQISHLLIILLYICYHWFGLIFWRRIWPDISGFRD